MAEANPTFTITSLNIQLAMNNFQTVVATSTTAAPAGDISSGLIGAVNDPNANISIPQGSPGGTTSPSEILNVITAYPSNCFAIYWDLEVANGEVEYGVWLYSFQHGSKGCFWKKKFSSPPTVTFDLKIDSHGGVHLTANP